MRQIRQFRLIDPTFHGRRSAYFLQASMASVVLALILVVEIGVSNAAITASIASSVFLVFVVPHSIASSTRRLFGGHLVGVVVGVSAYAALRAVAGDPGTLSTESLAVAGAIGVGVAILLMAITNTEHPPAAGTTLALITFGANIDAVLFILSGAAILAVIRLVMARRMTNLL
ncbi:MAG: HPP family protein [Chloroflexi bacterium]|nr:HPP family protein [Chloroflexota bacterium]